MSAEEAKKNTVVPQLPQCKQDTTIRTETGYNLDDNRKQVLMDMLFMKKEDVPLDYKEVFGERVIIRKYHRDKPNLVSLSALGIGVDCLPYRLRATRQYLFKDLGKNALKNYDKDPHGEGEFSAFMKAKLGLLEK
jgi:hypothetical protein